MASTKWHAAIEALEAAARRQEGDGVLVLRDALATILEAAKVGADAIGFEYAKYTDPGFRAAESFYRSFREGQADVAVAAAKEWSQAYSMRRSHET